MDIGTYFFLCFFPVVCPYFSKLPCAGSGVTSNHPLTPSAPDWINGKRQFVCKSVKGSFILVISTCYRTQAVVLDPLYLIQEMTVNFQV
ncbi:uncharacterized protein [Danio rerio]|uniref:Uncharacterized protein n=1 Tax=Danio rerio TaxID=7955 RepID=A0AC58H2U8_DANRE